MSYEVIVSGHICIDLLPDMEAVPLQGLAAPGKLFEVGPLVITTGGAVSNTGLALHTLGANVGLMTTVGSDVLGQTLISILTQHNQRLGQLIRVQQNRSSSYSILLSPEHQDRIILHCTGPNAFFGMNDIEFDLVADAKIFHLGYPPFLPALTAHEGEELVRIFERAQADVVTSMDMAHPDPNGPSGQQNWRAILEKTLPFVDVFLPSIEEILFMMRRNDYDHWGGDVMPHIRRPYLQALAEELIAMGGAIVGFKLGEMGIYLHTTGDGTRLKTLANLPVKLEEWLDVDTWHPSLDVEVVGTTGAGDAAYAGFLASMLRGLPPHETIRMATAVGACNCEAADATSSILSWEATVNRLGTGWQTVQTMLPD